MARAGAAGGAAGQARGGVAGGGGQGLEGRERGVGGGVAAAGMGGAAAPEIPEDLQELRQERAAIIAADGHVPPAEAARLAWAGLVPLDAGAVSAGGGLGACPILTSKKI